MAAAFSAWQGVMAAPSPGGAVRRCRTARLLTTLLVLLSGVPALAEPPTRRQAPHDLELELHARRALQKDKALVPYNLFVRVEQGVATVSGAVPSPELAGRAVQALKKVRDIHDVRDHTRVETFEAEESLRSLLAGLSGALPFDAQQLLSLDRPEDDGSGMSAATRGERSLRETFTARPETPARPPASFGPPVVLSIPTTPTGTPLLSSHPGPTGRTVSLLTRTDGDLRSEVERLLGADDRFSNLRSEIRQGVVTLRGRIAGAEHLIRLAGILSRVPGVREVDISQVQTAP
ncbi:MAG: BON domain-containing protein [Planctomycetes bacterium]|nr:BON domain-containing protein [Planctomycetota bacterium]